MAFHISHVSPNALQELMDLNKFMNAFIEQGLCTGNINLAREDALYQQ